MGSRITKARAAADPVAFAIAGIVEILAAIGLFSRWGFGPDEVAQIGAGLMMLGSGLFAVLHVKAGRTGGNQ